MIRPQLDVDTGGNGSVNGLYNPVSPVNAQYLDEMYARWKRDPKSVAESWHMFFDGFELALGGQDRFAESVAEAQYRVGTLMYAYRNQGHLAADIDPLASRPLAHDQLELEAHGFTQADLDTVFDAGHLGGDKGRRMTLREIVEVMRNTYCGTIGVEYGHVQDVTMRRWLQRELEGTRGRFNFDAQRKLEILHHLTESETFEQFIDTRYKGQKRFSLEGGESIIAALRALVDGGAEMGIEEMVFGMAHRGRLNVLANVLHKKYEIIFSEFEDKFLPGTVGGDGDVKYHRGYNSVHVTRSGKRIDLSVTANPSHLEAVNPVVEGRARARQRQRGDTEKRRRVVPVLIHGDAAFAGQGLVAEVLQLSMLPGYTTGGTVHFIINNQIGFTATPDESRSTIYASDVIKMIQAPVFHVNGDDPEAMVYATDVALRFRQEFGRDVLIDMNCYRLHGHNEGDEPAFTQPRMYEQIRRRETIRTKYAKRLISEGVLTEEEDEQRVEAQRAKLQEAFDDARKKSSTLNTQVIMRTEVPTSDLAVREPLWEELRSRVPDPTETNISHERLADVARALTTVPDGFRVHPKIKRQVIDKRRKAFADGGPVDWAFAELLAFGSLIREGTPVRLSGQDSARGTFSQRHAVWTDMETEVDYVPLRHIHPDQSTFCVYNSNLSEAGVLGFDYGYSLAEPRMLVLWEAQFGDFANGAQVIIDQFIVSSEAKWQRSSGIVMLLPHGYEGQGPEHSNAYLERYLQACAEDNIQVVNLSTPANYYHVLRRQMRRNFRKPLIVMSPKSLLRHKLVTSTVADLTDGMFREVVDDPDPDDGVRRVVLCTGKVYYDLIEERQARRERGTLGTPTAIVRVEQLYPVPEDLVRQAVAGYSNMTDLVWCQEEPQNRGAWTFMFPRLLDLFPDHRPRYVGRRAAASPATGSHKRHVRQQQALVDEALK